MAAKASCKFFDVEILRMPNFLASFVMRSESRGFTQGIPSIGRLNSVVIKWTAPRFPLVMIGSRIVVGFAEQRAL